MSVFAQARPRGLESFSRTAKGKIVLKKRRGVSRSAELIRVERLPRRSVEVYDEAFAMALSLELRRPGSGLVVRPKQAAMLVEAVEAGGIFCMCGTGEGKSFCSPLFGKVMGVAVVVMLVPPALKLEIEQRVIPRLLKEIDFVPPRVVSYSELSTAKGADILDRIKPGLIISDECHLLRNRTAARTKRFLRYFAENPDTMLVALSGTVTRRSLMDFWHVIQLTHKAAKCPVTRQRREAQDWALALDPQVPEDQRLMAGALVSLCQQGEEPRAGFNRRLLETEGIVGGRAEEVGTSLIFKKRSITVPPSVQAPLAQLRRTWETPAGEAISDAKDFARKARELAQGFYYEWVWPGGTPNFEWLEARKVWRKAVSEVCKLNREGLDSELLVRNAADRELLASKPLGVLPKATRDDVVCAWRAWKGLSGIDAPPTRAVWLSGFFVEDVLGWALERREEEGGGLAWVDSRAVMEQLAIRSRGHHSLYVCAAGDEGNTRLLSLVDRPEIKNPVAFCSTQSHGTGKNLQRWARVLVSTPWSGGATWEQAISRCHRPGQLADEMIVDVNAHTEELKRALDGALEQSQYIQDITSTRQKMLSGVWL